MVTRPHPLDPLTSSEISLSSQLIRDTHQSEYGWIFNSMILLEPEKSILLPLIQKPNSDFSSIPRKSFVVVIEKKTGFVYESIVNLTEKSMESFKAQPEGAQPCLTVEDCYLSEKITREDKNVQSRCRKLGLVDDDLVIGDPWSYGYNGEKEYDGKRIVQLFMYRRLFAEDNYYAHPLDFLVVVDLLEEKVLKIEDLPIYSDFEPHPERPVKLPDTPANYLPEFQPPGFYREDIKPLNIIQPEGPSFTVDGNEISWQRWKFRMSFNYRVGIVLHNVTFHDDETERPILYRASLSEMVIPYGDPRPPYNRKCAFDLGEYGMGFCANSLKLGCDCLGEIKYFDAVLNFHNGEPMVIKNAICLHEEDAGILHKHVEYRTNKAFIVRSRKLVLSFVATVVNYEYAFYWSFFQDGTINFEVKATGELSTNLLAKDATPAGYGTIVFPQVNAQFHQHIFCARLDWMVDGVNNSASTVDDIPLPGEYGSSSDPYDLGFTTKETVFKTSLQSKTNTQASTARFWTVSNPSEVHGVTGKPVGWKLLPMAGAFPRLLANDTSYIKRRAEFAKYNVWVTPFQDDELYASGLYINQSHGGVGLNAWANRDDNIENKDIVMWHVFGLTHIPRVEDFPIMPIEQTGFQIKPFNFFNTNPALDVPEPAECGKDVEGRDLKVPRCKKWCCHYLERRTPGKFQCSDFPTRAF